jgi:hypothetical protein
VARIRSVKSLPKGRCSRLDPFIMRFALLLAHPIPMEKSIWRHMAPSRVSFFEQTAVFGEILTIDNLRKRNSMDWYYMCKRS